MRKDRDTPRDPADADELIRLTEELERRNAALEAQVQEQDRSRVALLHVLEDLEREHKLVEQARRDWVNALDAVQDPIFIHDRAFKIVRANRAYARRAGCDIREVAGRLYWELFPKQDGPLASCLHAMEGEKSATEEVHLASGETFVNRNYPIYEDGNYLYSLHLLQDVTVQRRAEAEQRILSTALQQAAEAVLVLDRDGCMTYLNPAFYRLFGYAPEEVLGKPIATLAVPGEDEARQPPAVLASLHAQGRWRGELRRRARDGTAIPVLLSAAILRDEKNEISGYVGTYLDLREIKQTAAALREEKLFSDHAIESLPGVFYLFDTGGRFVRWNRNFEVVTGYTHEEVERMSPVDFFTGADRQHIAERIAEVFEKGESTAEAAFTTKDGGRIPFFFTGRRVELAGKIYLVGMGIDISTRARAEAALHRSNSALKALSACNAALVHAQNESGLLGEICRVIVEDGGYAYAWIGYAADGEARIRPMAQQGFEPGFLEAQSWPVQSQDPCSTAMREGMVEIVRGAANDPALAERRDLIERLGIGSIAAFPLLRGDEAFGVLSIYSRERDAFDQGEMNLLAEMAEDLNFGILTLRARVEHERLQEEHLKTAERLKETLSDTIRAIALTVEKRDPYTAGHQNKVADLCAAIGRELKLPEDRIEGLRLGATIHDIGKVYVPAEILNRPGKLTNAEFEIIKSHPQIGYDIVKDVKFPWPVAQMILQHHERLDGSGYPAGLKSEDIILEARILAVADTVEAMASHRPYRPAHGLDAGLVEIERHRGDWYDPAVVDACMRLFREKGFAFTQEAKT